MLEAKNIVENLLKTNNNLLEATGMDIYLGKTKINKRFTG